MLCACVCESQCPYVLFSQEILARMHPWQAGQQNDAICCSLWNSCQVTFFFLYPISIFIQCSSLELYMQWEKCCYINVSFKSFHYYHIRNLIFRVKALHFHQASSPINSCTSAKYSSDVLWSAASPRLFLFWMCLSSIATVWPSIPALVQYINFLLYEYFQCIVPCKE